MVIEVGKLAPDVPGVTIEGPRVLVFYKVTCPTCQMAAPPLEGFERAYPGRVAGVGQDPLEKLVEFSRAYGLSFPSVADEPPYDVSNAYGIGHVPTVIVVDGDDRVADVVESWDRAGVNRTSAVFSALVGADAALISDPADGLPSFRPG